MLKEVPKEREEELKKEIARGREEITRTILAEAKKIIPQYGIELVDVRIKRLDYVESVREKVYERMISERKRIAAQFRSEGEGRSAEILGTMEKELRRIRSTAYRQVQEVQGKADADATRIYGQAYNKNPEFYAFLRTLESYKEKTNRMVMISPPTATSINTSKSGSKHTGPIGSGIPGEVVVGRRRRAVGLR